MKYSEEMIMLSLYLYRKAMTFACSYGWYVYLYLVCIFTFNSLWGEGNFGALLSFHNHLAMTFVHRHGRYLYLYLVCIWFVFAFVPCIHPLKIMTILVPCCLCITVKQWLLPVGMVGLGLFCNNTLTDTPGKPGHRNNKAIGSNPPPPPPLGSISVCLPPSSAVYVYHILHCLIVFCLYYSTHIRLRELHSIWDWLGYSYPKLAQASMQTTDPTAASISQLLCTRYKYEYVQNTNTLICKI